MKRNLWKLRNDEITVPAKKHFTLLSTPFKTLKKNGKEEKLRRSRRIIAKARIEAAKES